MAVPVHKFALYEIAESSPEAPETPPATSIPTPATRPPGAIPAQVTGAELTALLNHLSGNATLGPVLTLAEGVMLIGELTGFAHLEIGQGIIPAVMAPGNNRRA